MSLNVLLPVRWQPEHPLAEEGHVPLVKGDADQVQQNFENSGWLFAMQLKLLRLVFIFHLNVPRYNVAQLDELARDQNIEETGSMLIDTLLPIIQVGDNV